MLNFGVKFEVVLQKQFLSVATNHLKWGFIPLIEQQNAGKFIKCIPQKFPELHDAQKGKLYWNWLMF